MSNESPRTDFTFTNNNVNEEAPALGVSHVVARTSKGPFCDPSTLIRNPTQFRKIFGSEIVPDGSISNIERALSLGSLLRISRVKGAGDVAFGFAKTYNIDTGVGGTEPVDIHIKLQNPMVTTENIDLQLKIVTKEAGSSIVDPNSNNADANFYLELSVDKSTPLSQYYLKQFKAFDANDNVDSNTIISKDLLFKATGLMDGSAPIMVSPDTFVEFINHTPNITLELISCTTSIGDLATSVTNIEHVISVLQTYKDWYGTILGGAIAIDTATPQYFIINEGDNGGTSTKAEWLEAYESTLDYTENYQTILSHIHQHIPNDYTEVYKNVMDIASRVFEHMVYIEVPKYNESGEVMTQTEIISKANTMVSTIGYHKNSAYYCGGIKLYNQNGALKPCDVLGTVLGLGDKSAASFGPYYSFAGPNRGIVFDGLGPVISNLGSPAKYNELNELAAAKLNLFVIKDTTSSGKRTMLWHNFTSTFMDSSDKFISAVKLQLFLKKNLRPLIEKRYEEPNTFAMWKSLYYEAKPLMDSLLGISYTEYNWAGDQFATKYSDLVINNEADVRAGKYKLRIGYRDIVTLQIVEVDVVIEKASKSISFNVSE